MKSRYIYSKETNDLENRFRKLDSTLYPDIFSGDNDLYIISTATDRLDLLAEKYYGDVNLWWIIAQANNIGKGSLNITPGIKIRIPQNIENVYSNLETINRKR